MGKKIQQDQPVDDTMKSNPETDAPEGAGEFPGDEGTTDPSNALGALDFDVENEYKPDPLIPIAPYHGVVTKVSLNAQQFCIVWDIALQDNGGFMNDGSTPVDGAHVWFRNWLPKPGDENELTKSGKNNKRQSKINMLKDFETQMGIDMSTPVIIATALAEAQWVGLEVDVEVGIDQYMGRFKNVANRMKKRAY